MMSFKKISPLDSLNVVSMMGKTPFYSFTHGKGKIVLKIEKGNPGGSIKDRAAWGMLRFLDSLGKLRKDSIIVEPTSGNTGIALALYGRALGLSVRLTMPETMSLERRKLLECYGADLVLTQGNLGMAGAIETARDMAAEDSRVVVPDQFSNPGNPWAHEVTTAPECVAFFERNEPPSAFIAGVGTGGTLTGIARGLKKRYPRLSVLALEPKENQVLSGKTSGSHGIQGIGAGFVPANCDLSILDGIIAISTEEALEKSLWFTRKHGLFCGFSTGANLAGAMKLLEEGTVRGTILTIAPDGGERYLSTYPQK
jgi:cysteine synthase A